MKTKIILDIKWLQEKRKTRPGKMIQTAEFLYLVAGRCSAGDSSNESSKVAFSCLPRVAGSQLVAVGTLFYPCKTGENLYFEYGSASVGGRAPCSLC
jgi:hypothetical protein